MCRYEKFNSNNEKERKNEPFHKQNNIQVARNETPAKSMTKQTKATFACDINIVCGLLFRFFYFCSFIRSERDGSIDIGSKCFKFIGYVRRYWCGDDDGGGDESSVHIINKTKCICFNYIDFVLFGKKGVQA